MTDLLVDLVAYLDAATSLQPTVDLFVGDLPDQPDAATVLHETGGNPPFETMGADAQPAVIRPRVQVLARDVTYPGAKARIGAVYAALVLVTNEAVNGSYHLRVSPVQQPFFLQRDEAERVVFGVNFDVERVAEATAVGSGFSSGFSSGFD